jgi:hypothetical protein
MNLLKRLEQPTHFSLGKAGPVVAHGKPDLRILAARRQTNCPARRAILDRVGDQVVQDLSGAQRVTLYQGLTGRVRRNCNAVFSCNWSTGFSYEGLHVVEGPCFWPRGAFHPGHL